jgi:putative ABC transport system permease protein
MLADYFRMPLRFMRGSSTRLAFTVIALACAVGLVCAIDLVNRAVLRAFVEVIDTMAGRAALQVTTGQGGLFPEEVATTVAAVPGVDLAVPVVSATAFAADGTRELLTVQGVEITSEAAVRVYQGSDSSGLDIKDPLGFLNQPDSVVVTREFASQRGLSIGDPINIETPTGRRSLFVRALLDAKGVARIHGGNLLVMDLWAAQAAFARPGFINRVDVVVKHEEDVAGVAEAIRTAIPVGLQVEAPAQRKADLQKVMQSVQALLRAVGLLGLVAAFLIAFNRLATVFEQRVWQLGVMRAAGVEVRVVRRELVKESLLLGVAGIALGIPFGIGLGRLLLPVIATTTALSSKLVMPDAELSVRGPSLILAASLGLISALLAAVVPARRTAAVAIAETLRNRGGELPVVNARRMWAVRGLILLCTAVAIVLQSITASPEWGLAASGGIVIATAMAARPLLHLLTFAAVPGVTRLVGPTSRLAMATLVRSPGRSALTIATLGVGFGTVLWLWMLAQSFERSVINTMPGVLRGDLAVNSAYLGSGFVEAPVDDALVGEISNVPGVAVVVGEQAIDWHYEGGPIAIEAFDAQYFGDPRFGEWPLVGERLPDVWADIASGDGAIISTNFALHLSKRVGDTITLDTPTGPLSLRVGGMMSTFLSPRGTIVINRELYKRYWNDPQIVHALVKTAPHTDVRAVRSAITRALGSRYELGILSLGELIQWFAGQVRRAFAALYLLAGMVMLVVIVGVTDTLAASVFERTREIGLLRAVGVRRSQLRRMILAEGLSLGAIGVVLAATAGLALGTLWVESTFPHLLGWILDLYIPYKQLAMIGTVGLAVCLLAALIPSRRAARLEPAVALRYE